MNKPPRKIKQLHGGFHYSFDSIIPGIDLNLPGSF